jgi:hypothetical protein
MLPSVLLVIIFVCECGDVFYYYCFKSAIDTRDDKKDVQYIFPCLGLN